ncbi:hypothetical protein PRZ48_011378 [Zasmidium cellare]|uniref:WW domain-containing protein n=1 Tax=Zasmidium cellare TaxID=395010 RepID=A0ABR0E691_ZASCE|nr:hypothetical protein PRZ48_011378 [Zasmidium cellare]
MASNDIPSEAPPSYAQATGSSSSSSRPAAGTSSSQNTGSHLNVPGASSGGKNGIPAAYRRSMEDEMRPLPDGWVRSYDDKAHHQFFVDITKDPPKSQWVHPYDSEEYLSTLSTEERERIEQDSMNRGKHEPSKEDIIAAHSDDDGDHHHSAAVASSSSSHPELPPRPDGKGKATDRTFGRKLKDKLTGMSHEERVQERKVRAEQEQKMYEQHMRVRQAMAQAMQTGQPQYLGKDRDGKDVYVEPPAPPAGYGYGGGYGGGYGYSGGGYGYSPYRGAQGGPGIYSTPNARYIRPQQPYGRPGYGGGYGLPLAAGIGGGLLGGLLLGDLLF